MLLTSCMVHRNNTTAGPTPKLTKSLKESNSAPNRLVPFNRRATRPSSPSNTPAAMIASTACSNF